MKKKIFIISCLLFILTFNSFSQNTDLKYYSDYSKDFSGYSVAVYLGNLNDLEIGEKDFFEMISEEIDGKLQSVSKLTKKNKWLFNKAMNEWDYEKNEVYWAMCFDSKLSTEGILLIVVVRGKDDFSWIAYSINEDDIDTLDTLFEDTESGTTVTAIPLSEEYVSGQREIYDWYTSLGIIQTTTCDNPPATVRVDVALAYKKDDTATSTEINNRTVEIKAFLRKYFNTKTAAELRNTNNEDILENEIKNAINENILSSSRIRDVVFQQKDVIEQK